jgi:hypothetical protein
VEVKGLALVPLLNFLDRSVSIEIRGVVDPIDHISAGGMVVPHILAARFIGSGALVFVICAASQALFQTQMKSNKLNAVSERRMQ